MLVEVVLVEAVLSEDGARKRCWRSRCWRKRRLPNDSLARPVGARPRLRLDHLGGVRGSLDMQTYAEFASRGGGRFAVTAARAPRPAATGSASPPGPVAPRRRVDCDDGTSPQPFSRRGAPPRDARRGVRRLRQPRQVRALVRRQPEVAPDPRVLPCVASPSAPRDVTARATTRPKPARGPSPSPSPPRVPRSHPRDGRGGRYPRRRWRAELRARRTRRRPDRRRPRTDRRRRPSRRQPSDTLLAMIDTDGTMAVVRVAPGLVGPTISRPRMTRTPSARDDDDARDVGARRVGTGSPTRAAVPSRTTRRIWTGGRGRGAIAR